MAIKKLILDLDMGVDDAMALAYAIASPEVELVGITTCFGNVRVDQSAHNCLAVLDLLGRPEVPVYLGADRPLQATEPYTPPASTALIHGKNGIGGASVPVAPFAEGGIVASPSYFPTGRGLGLMGESGAEAILPLSRGPDGRLGVQAGGGAPRPLSVTVQVSTPDAASFRRSEAQVAAAVARAVARGSRAL